jgi:hypothetical protein
MAKPITKILALDPGTQTGWALYNGHGWELSGTWDFKPRRGDGAGVRFLRLRARLDETCATVDGLDRLVYELPAGHYKSGAASDVINGLVSHIQSWAKAAGVPYEAVAPSQIKKFATGKGAGKGTDKNAMLRIARERWKDISDHNEADARFILQMVLDGELE